MDLHPYSYALGFEWWESRWKYSGPGGPWTLKHRSKCVTAFKSNIKISKTVKTIATMTKTQTLRTTHLILIKTHLSHTASQEVVYFRKPRETKHHTRQNIQSLTVCTCLVNSGRSFPLFSDRFVLYTFYIYHLSHCFSKIKPYYSGRS